MRSLIVILGLALLLRLAFVLVIDPTPRLSGGDSDWFLKTGAELLADQYVGVPQSGPIYLLYTGLLQKVFSTETTIQVIRVMNGLMGAALCGFAYLIGRRLFSVRVGLLAAFLIAVNPIFIIESGAVLTESVFVFLLYGAVALYIVGEPTPRRWRLATVGLLLGITTLTRAATLLFPAVLILHLLVVYRRRAARPILILATVYVVTLAPWTIYNWVRWNKFIVGADGLIANIYLGTTDQGWCGARCVDAQAGIGPEGNNQAAYLSGALSALKNIPSYLAKRVRSLIDATLQPHNTVYYPGESIKQLVSEWWSKGHLLSEAGALTQADNFWPKLALYIFHYVALVFGLIGLLIGLRAFVPRLPLYGLIGYFLAVHSVLLVIPRYLFPIEAAWLMFASVALVRIAQMIQLRWQSRQNPTRASESGLA